MPGHAVSVGGGDAGHVSVGLPERRTDEETTYAGDPSQVHGRRRGRWRCRAARCTGRARRAADGGGAGGSPVRPADPARLQPPLRRPARPYLPAHRHRAGARGGAAGGGRRHPARRALRRALLRRLRRQCRDPRHRRPGRYDRGALGRDPPRVLGRRGHRDRRGLSGPAGGLGRHAARGHLPRRRSGRARDRRRLRPPLAAARTGRRPPVRGRGGHRRRHRHRDRGDGHRRRTAPRPVVGAHRRRWRQLRRGDALPVPFARRRRCRPAIRAAETAHGPAAFAAGAAHARGSRFPAVPRQLPGLLRTAQRAGRSVRRSLRAAQLPHRRHVLRAAAHPARRRETGRASTFRRVRRRVDGRRRRGTGRAAGRHAVVSGHRRPGCTTRRGRPRHG